MAPRWVIGVSTVETNIVFFVSILNAATALVKKKTFSRSFSMEASRPDCLDEQPPPAGDFVRPKDESNERIRQAREDALIAMGLPGFGRGDPLHSLIPGIPQASVRSLKFF
jgi:hypothetical protein